jgi:hypothetical protein
MSQSVEEASFVGDASRLPVSALQLPEIGVDVRRQLDPHDTVAIDVNVVEAGHELDRRRGLLPRYDIVVVDVRNFERRYESLGRPAIVGVAVVRRDGDAEKG